MKKAKPGGPSRLTDITVEEVSLVDRAANNHRFLLVKRSDAMQLNGDESLEPIELASEEDEANDEAAEAGATGASGEPPKDPWGPMLEALTGITTRLDALLVKPATEPEVAETEAKPRPKPAEPTDGTLKPRPKPAEPTDGTLRTTLEGIGATMTKLLELVKGQGARLTTLEKSTPERASVPEARSEPASVSWPLDMNPPTERRLGRPSGRAGGGAA